MEWSDMANGGGPAFTFWELIFNKVIPGLVLGACVWLFKSQVEDHQNVAVLQSAHAELKAVTENRLDRIERKLDFLIEHRQEARK